jgi:ribosomal protein S18 acetylase RimI-like enzyme
MNTSVTCCLCGIFTSSFNLNITGVADLPTVQFSVEFIAPQPAEYSLLKANIGRGEVNADMVKTALQNSLFHVVIRQENELIAMGRVIGDGALFFYIQDVIVAPEFQGQGLGKLVMSHIEIYLAKVAQAGATIGLFAAKGKESFYVPYAYVERDGDTLGKGMCKFL